jgi:hypothetical protein
MTIAHRVASRFVAAAGEEIPFAQYIAPKSNLVDLAFRLIRKENPSINAMKAPAGGVSYFLTRMLHETALADKMQKIFETQDGLDTDPKWEELAHKIFLKLSPSLTMKKLEAAGLVIALLDRTRQLPKARKISVLLSHTLKAQAAQMPPAAAADPSAKPAGAPLYKFTYVEQSATEDDYKNGETLNGHIKLSENVNKSFTSLEALLAYATSNYGFPDFSEDKDAWVAFEDGRIDCQWMEDGNGIRARTGDRIFESWKVGEAKLYAIYGIISVEEAPAGGAVPQDDIAAELGIGTG